MMCHGTDDTPGERLQVAQSRFTFVHIQLYYQPTMGQTLSAIMQCISALTGVRRQGSVRLTEGDVEAAPADTMTLSATQDTGPKPVYIAYVTTAYPCRVTILMVTPGSWALLGVERHRFAQPIDLPCKTFSQCSLQFVNLASGSSLDVGQGLESCTAEVQPSVPFSVGDKQVILIDTPGFGDTTLADSDIWKIIAASFVTR